MKSNTIMCPDKISLFPEEKSAQWKTIGKLKADISDNYKIEIETDTVRANTALDTISGQGRKTLPSVTAAGGKARTPSELSSSETKWRGWKSWGGEIWVSHLCWLIGFTQEKKVNFLLFSRQEVVSQLRACFLFLEVGSCPPTETGREGRCLPQHCISQGWFFGP